MTNRFQETISKIRQNNSPVALNSEEDFEARRQVSEDMTIAKRTFAIKSYNSQISATKIILNA